MNHGRRSGVAAAGRTAEADRGQGTGAELFRFGRGWRRFSGKSPERDGHPLIVLAAGHCYF